MDLSFTNAVDKACDYYERPFLEAWYSQIDQNAGNAHIDIPNIYKSLA